MESSAVGIHGNATFTNFEFSFFTLPMYLLFVPIIYIPITVVIILRTLVKLYFAIQDRNENIQLFTVISMSSFMSLIIFISDFFFIRLPTTGIFTSWCARMKPNRYLTAFFIFKYHINYSAMIFPCAVSTMRLILLLYPTRHKSVINHNQCFKISFLQLNGRLLRFLLPFLLFYPFLLTFFMFPALGYCSSAKHPFPFGAIIFRIENTLFGLANSRLLLFITGFWMTASMINNWILLVKLIKARCSLSARVRSQFSYKEERSLTLMTFSMIFFFLSNGIFLISRFFFPDYLYYAIMFRPFGNDLVTCVVPWVFYLTHPVFRKKIVRQIFIFRPGA
ncbi:Protein CBG26387 [Caenorhabditis briggsae]|uniref:Protein CBG26387 n=1 Tax=Caenorhabditis briggsae TaxID=6238 RepID=B6IFE6_CAEBR|nr:Protein CBG26387 [Caenorhabditis briggsae]CAR98626.1 Protein CBG26387 [Caenorhabditis briggsae]